MDDRSGGRQSQSTGHPRNGVVADALDFFGAGKPYYDPAKITVPTLLVDAEWDRDAPP